MAKEIAHLQEGCFWCMVKRLTNQESARIFYRRPQIKHKGSVVNNRTWGRASRSTQKYSLRRSHQQQTDPTDAMGQFVDRGDYAQLSSIIPRNKKDCGSFKSMLKRADDSKVHIVTKIEPAALSICERIEFPKKEIRKRGKLSYMIILALSPSMLNYSLNSLLQ